ncbi:MAG: methionine--tRNA ligase [Deltaproteobacteria bacterium]|nr:methionine--tRNA ligase [Deltaproteobacteria bacterium]
MTKKNSKFYITTAIDYVNSLPHIGTAYEKIGADVLARFMRMQGCDVHFQMGNDEHSINVEKAAVKAGLDPKKYCDQMRQKFEAIWKKLDISYDDFIQTSEPRHIKGVQKLFQKVFDAGDIYKKHFEGWYCESCEAYKTEKDLVEGLCPDHKSKPKWLKEENYFFKLSSYQDKLHQHIKKHPEFILPEMRRNEILRLIEGGLQDVSVSRASVQWGIPVPFDETHAVYVWFDALINYITAIGYGTSEAKFKKWWPAQVHVIGKDITRFHCVIWPAMLMSAGIKLPQTVFGHGFVYLKGEKMSKTLGNVVTPMDVADAYGADALRYYLLRGSSFGQDGDFTWDDFIRRYNGDLANGLGNVVSRTLGMIEQYLGSELPALSKKKSDLSSKLTGIAKKMSEVLEMESGNIDFHDALGYVWEGISEVDRFINENKPWALAKEGKEKVLPILQEVAESLRIITILLKPFLPSTAENIWNQFGFEKLGKFEKQTFKEASKWGGLNKKCVIKKSVGMFPRIEEKKMEEKIEPSTKNQVLSTNLIDIADFAKVELRVAQILQAEKVEGADKLLKLQIDLGTEKRQIVAGIALHYTPEELVGKKVVVVVNLKPAKIRGVESNGMLLAASDASVVSILTPLKDVTIGSKVK